MGNKGQLPPPEGGVSWRNLIKTLEELKQELDATEDAVDAASRTAWDAEDALDTVLDF